MRYATLVLCLALTACGDAGSSGDQSEKAVAEKAAALENQANEAVNASIGQINADAAREAPAPIEAFQKSE